MADSSLALEAQLVRFPVQGHFTISRGSATVVHCLEVRAVRQGLLGRGESAPERSGMDGQAALVAVRDFAAQHSDFGRLDLLELLPQGPVRSAIDLALWDLEAKEQGQPAWRLAGLTHWAPVTTAYTISIDRPERMEQAARQQAARPILKIKLTGQDDLERVAAVRRGAPDSRLVVDANESWTPAYYRQLVGPLQQLGVELIEQPFPRAGDQALSTLERPIPVCADESCRTRADLAGLMGLYDWINIKLDKSGGLTEALALSQAARAAGLGVMVGCMLASSLALAPALLLAQEADLVDLDAHLLLARDRQPGLTGSGSQVDPPPSVLWG